MRSVAVVWSPIVQTLIKLPGAPQDQLRLALTRTFKAPELDSLLPRRRRVEINAATNPDFEGNPALRPETARGLDASVEHHFTKTALLSLALSRRELDDYVSTEVAYGADGRWVGRPVNAGRASVRSLALETKFPLVLLWAAAPAIELCANLNRNWSSVAQVAATGNRMAQQIALSAAVAFDYSHGVLGTGTSLGFLQDAWTRTTATQSVYRGRRRDMDLYALWKFAKKRQLRLTVGNLLAQDNFAATQYHNEAGSSTRRTIAAGEISVRALFENAF